MLSLLSDNWRLVLSMVLALLIGWNIRVPVFKMAILKNFVDNRINVLHIPGVFRILGELLFF